MRNFFKPEDFESLLYNELSEQNHIQACNIANIKLNILTKSWPAVYKYSDDSKWITNEESMSAKDERFFDFDQKARLAFVEEIVKEQCKHEPNQLEPTMFLTRDGWQYQKVKCIHCGIELVAEWKAK